MIVPVFAEGSAIDKDGDWTPPWKGIFEHLFQNLQISVSDEGYLIPSVSSATNSVNPPAVGGQLKKIQDSFNSPIGEQGGAQKGTLVFDPAEVNGGTSDQPNGQLKILLGDGIFHAIPNS